MSEEFSAIMDDDVLDEVVRRNLLVVKSGAHRRKLAQEIYVGLIGVQRSVDVVVVTPEDVERFGDSRALVIETALREGVEVYAA